MVNFNHVQKRPAISILYLSQHLTPSWNNKVVPNVGVKINSVLVVTRFNSSRLKMLNIECWCFTLTDLRTSILWRVLFMWWSRVHRIHRVVTPFFSQRTMWRQPVPSGENRSCFPTNLNSVAHAQWLALAARTAGSAAAAAAGEQIYLSNLSGKKWLQAPYFVEL